MLPILLLIACGDNQPITIDDSPFIHPEIIKVYNGVLNDSPIVTIGSKEHEFIVSYFRDINGETHFFEVVQGKFPIVMKDEDGNLWDVFGNNTSLPDGEMRLKATLSSTGFWFGWSSMYPGIIINGEEEVVVDYVEEWTDDWNLPESFIRRGANIDAIEALETPAIVIYNEKQDLNSGFHVSDEEWVVAVQVNGHTRIYPHSILNWHEIVNDTLGGEDISVVFSPFTSTATAWSRNTGLLENHFGISGLVFNNNILAFDRNTRSHWSQLRGTCVNGTYKGYEITHFPLIETKWKTIKEIYREPEVISDKTSYDFDYREYPLGDYLTNPESIPFPLYYSDDRLPRKQRVHGIAVDGKAKVFRLDDF